MAKELIAQWSQGGQNSNCRFSEVLQVLCCTSKWLDDSSEKKEFGFHYGNGNYNSTSKSSDIGLNAKKRLKRILFKGRKLSRSKVKRFPSPRRYWSARNARMIFLMRSSMVLMLRQLTMNIACSTAFFCP